MQDLILKLDYRNILIKRKSHLVIFFILNLMFVFSAKFCDYREPTNDLKWWILRMNLYAIIFLIAVISNYLPRHRYSYFLMSLLIGFCISDVVDRTWFDIRTFTKEDKTMIRINFITSYLIYHKKYIKNKILSIWLMTKRV